MQEIIVYCNPLEAAFWNAVSTAEFLPVIAGIAVFFAVFLVLNAVCRRMWGNWGRRAALHTNISLALAALAGVFTVWKMWL